MAPGWLWGWALGLGIEVGDSIDSIACQVGTEALKHYRPWFNSFSGLTLFYTFLCGKPVPPVWLEPAGEALKLRGKHSLQQDCGS